MTIDLLERRKAAIVADLRLKVEVEDWHGVADAAMDLREIEAMLKVFAFQAPKDMLSADAALCRHTWQ